MCSPNDLFNILSKIEEQEYQKEAIQKGIDNLFYKERTECVIPLLDALEGNESFKHLKDIAIKRAFGNGSVWRNKSLMERFYDHYAVTPEVYAGVLIYSGRQSPH